MHRHQLGVSFKQYTTQIVDMFDQSFEWSINGKLEIAQHNTQILK